MKPDLMNILVGELNKRNNPIDLKTGIIGVVKQLSPLVVSINEGAINLTENDNLLISEWFRFRCNIDSTGALSSTVPSDLDSATAVTETHSYTGAACTMPDAISYLADAITQINTELLALKCNLALGDKVVISSLEQTDLYIIIDKVLNNVS